MYTAPKLPLRHRKSRLEVNSVTRSRRKSMSLHRPYKSAVQLTRALFEVACSSVSVVAHTIMNVTKSKSRKRPSRRSTIIPRRTSPVEVLLLAKGLSICGSNGFLRFADLRKLLLVNQRLNHDLRRSPHLWQGTMSLNQRNRILPPKLEDKDTAAAKSELPYYYYARAAQSFSRICRQWGVVATATNLNRVAAAPSSDPLLDTSPQHGASLPTTSTDDAREFDSIICPDPNAYPDGNILDRNIGSDGAVSIKKEGLTLAALSYKPVSSGGASACAMASYNISADAGTIVSSLNSIQKRVHMVEKIVASTCASGRASAGAEVILAAPGHLPPLKVCSLDRIKPPEGVHSDEWTMLLEDMVGSVSYDESCVSFQEAMNMRLDSLLQRFYWLQAVHDGKYSLACCQLSSDERKASVCFASGARITTLAKELALFPFMRDYTDTAVRTRIQQAARSGNMQTRRTNYI